jgi:hypothetical protein
MDNGADFIDNFLGDFYNALDYLISGIIDIFFDPLLTPLFSGD